MNFLLNLLEFNEEIPFKIIFIILGLSFAFMWFSLFVWVVFDSKFYFRSVVFRVFFSFITLILGFVGLLIYLLFRSSKFKQISGSGSLDDDLWMTELLSCPKCLSLNLRENSYCTNCGESLKRECPECKSEITVIDRYCPNCGTQINTDEPNNKASKSVKKYNLKKNFLKKIANFKQLRYIKDAFCKKKKKSNSSKTKKKKVNKKKKSKRKSNK